MAGEQLEPITRKEMFLAKAAGMDIKTPEPITREEMFISMISGGGTGGSGGGEKADICTLTIVSGELIISDTATALLIVPIDTDEGYYKSSKTATEPFATLHNVENVKRRTVAFLRLTNSMRINADGCTVIAQFTAGAVKYAAVFIDPSDGRSALISVSEQ